MKRHIIITGGASGIGLAIVRRFVQHDWRVHVLELDTKAARETLSDFSNDEVSVYPCDVSRHKDVMRIIHTIGEDHVIHSLVNNAGIAHVGNVEKTTEKDLDRIYAVNVKGVYNCIHAVVPYMKRHGGGCIINMASVLSSVGVVDRFAYSMSKGAVFTMTLSVAKDYLDYGIRCNSVSPARVHTPFVDGFIEKNYPGKEREMFEKLSKTQPIGRMARPEEVAGLVFYLCSDEASFITGTDFPIDGGFIKLNT